MSITTVDSSFVNFNGTAIDIRTLQGMDGIDLKKQQEAVLKAEGLISKTYTVQLTFEEGLQFVLQKIDSIFAAQKNDPKLDQYQKRMCELSLDILKDERTKDDCTLGALITLIHEESKMPWIQLICKILERNKLIQDARNMKNGVGIFV